MMDTVFFVLSKVARVFIDPGNLIFILLIGSTALMWLNRNKSAKVLLSFASVLAVLLISLPIGQNLQVFLENRFPANPILPDRVDGIIVLGGVVSARLTVVREQPVVGGSIERLMAFSRLAKTYPDAKTVVTGGSGSLLDQEFKEADFVGPILSELGMDTKATVFENQSRNTFENAVYSKNLISPGPDEVWILITSAGHMPRAVGAFRAAGWPEIIPYPVDFRTLPEYIFAPAMSFRGGISQAASAISQGIGLLAYYLTGKSSALIPGP